MSRISQWHLGRSPFWPFCPKHHLHQGFGHQRLSVRHPKKYNLGIFRAHHGGDYYPVVLHHILFRRPINSLQYAVYFRPFFYVVIVGAVYVAVLLFLQQVSQKQIDKIRPMIHLAAFNGAVFGSASLKRVCQMDFWGYLAFGIGTSIGIHTGLLPDRPGLRPIKQR